MVSVSIFGGMQPHRATSVPHAQPVSLMFRLGVAAEDFQHELLVVACRWGHPGRLTTRLERLADTDGPLPLQAPDRRARVLSRPCRLSASAAAIRFAGLGEPTRP